MYGLENTGGIKMNSVIISLVSEQTIPNTLFIKNMKREDTNYIFISTKSMEDKNKTNNIIKAADIESEKCNIIIVLPDDLKKIKEKLESMKLDYEKKILNITCGTKIMSLAVYEYLLKYNPDMYYLSLGKKEMLKIHPYPVSTIGLKQDLTLHEYLCSCGIEYSASKHFYGKNKCEYMLSNYEEYFNIISRTRDLRNENWVKNRFNNNKLIDLTSEKCMEKLEITASKETVQFQELFRSLNFNIKEINKYEMEFIIGGWLEEYTYLLIKNKIILIEENILKGVNVIRNDVRNEIDVLFIRNNALFIIECKTHLFAGEQRNLLADTIYKQNSLKNEFGLLVNSRIITCDEDIKKSGLDRAENFNIKVITRKDLMSINNFHAKIIGEA